MRHYFTKLKTSSGFLTLMAVIYISLMLVIATSFISYVFNARRVSHGILEAAQARFIAEAGLEKAIWNLNQGSNYTGETNTNYGGGQFTTIVNTVDSNTRQVRSTAYIPNSASPRAVKVITATVSIDTSLVSFMYGVQAGEGGVEMGNNSIIVGNLYSNGPVVGSPGAIIEGDAYSAGSSGLIRDVAVVGNARANTIQNCTVQGDAYYQTINLCTVSGSSNPGAADPEPQDLPLTSEQIAEWKTAAENGGVINGNYTISTNVSLGPKKIVGNLTVINGVTLTLTGRVWVTGTILFDNNATIRLDPLYGQGSEVVIADGRITLANNVILENADEGSFIMILSESNSLSATSPAIQVTNNAEAGIFYARNGVVLLNNNVYVKEVTAYKMKMNNNVNLTYDSGFANANFTGGPGASWFFDRGSYFSE